MLLCGIGQSLTNDLGHGILSANHHEFHHNHSTYQGKERFLHLEGTLEVDVLALIPRQAEYKEGKYHSNYKRNERRRIEELIAIAYPSSEDIFYGEDQSSADFEHSHFTQGELEPLSGIVEHRLERELLYSGDDQNHNKQKGRRKSLDKGTAWYRLLFLYLCCFGQSYALACYQYRDKESYSPSD